MDSKDVWQKNALDTPSAPQAVFECDQNQNQNARHNPLISNGTNSQEVCDLNSNALINYIGQILLEENIDDEISIYEEEAALRETEKSFYDLIERDDVPPYTICQPLLISGSADPISALSMENLPAATRVQKGAQEAMKFLPAIEKLFVGLEPNRIEFHEKPKKNDVSENENKAICYETYTKTGSSNDREPDLSEGPALKQRAVSADDEQARNDLDQFLLFRGSKYVKEVISVREGMKQDVKNESLKALGKKETRDCLVNLHSLLISCCKAVSADDHNRASELIKQIRKHAYPMGNGDQRLAYYLADALEARLAGTGSDIYHKLLSRQGTMTEYLKVFRVYHAICPFMKALYYFSIQTILNISKNATKVHIIDFGIDMGFLWPSFFERLSRLGSTPPKICITGIEFPEKGFRPNKLVEETGRRLLEYAKRFNIHLKYQGIASKWENIRIEDLKIEKDEILVVNCLIRLRKVADETISDAMICPRDKVLNLIREIKPRVFIHGINNGSYITPFYTTRFKEVLSTFSSFFDIFESTMPRESEARLHIERTVLIPRVINAIACEGSERVERPETYRQWQARNLRAGFVQLPVDSLIKKKIERMVRELYHKDYLIEETNKWLLLGWKGTILLGLSTWKPNENEC
ncbi:scarecrow-like protein 34 [Carex rostrata]